MLKARNSKLAGQRYKARSCWLQAGQMDRKTEPLGEERIGNAGEKLGKKERDCFHV